MALSVPLSLLISQVGCGSAFFVCRIYMIKPETLIWMLLAGQAVFAICLGLSKLRLMFACPLAAAAMFVALVYDIQAFGFPEMGGLFQLLLGGSIPFIVRRVKQRGSFLPRDPKG
jgi:hypothetical protein